MTRPAALLLAALLAISTSTAAFAQKPARAGELEPVPQPSKLFPHLGKHLVLINGDNSAGSGSVIMMGGVPMLVTNAHVLGGAGNVSFQRVDGSTVKLTKLSVAEKVDLVTYTQTTAKEGLEMMLDVETKANIGDDVVVLGNSQGMNVVTEVPGKIVGIGPAEIEVDAKFVGGNSGSPIIHVKTGKVVAIATYALVGNRDAMDLDSKFASVRRFGVRLDAVKTWESPNWATFQKEAGILGAVKTQTNDLLRVLQDFNKPAGIQLDHFDARNRLKRHIVDYMQIKTKPNMAQSTKNEARNKFFRTMIFECGFDLQNLRPEQFGSYHGEVLKKQTKIRESLKKAFVKQSNGEQAVDRIFEN